MGYEPGETVDEFTITGKVHVGGMAVIYQVEGPNLEFPAIMKVPRVGFGEPGTHITGIEIEETMLRALKGKHVPRFVAAGDIMLRPYIVMEFIEGKTLADWVERAPLDDPDEAAMLGAALATALHSIHVQDAVHLDIKPGNVIIKPDGTAVLIDYGLAHHARYPDLLAEEWLKPIGSAPYISPEQVLGVRHDHRSDIFSLGVILYELTTGKLPFGSPTNQWGLRRRLWKDPTPPRAINPKIPVWFQEIILRCLEPRVDRRYKTAAQVSYDLTHPSNVEITERGRRSHGAGPITLLKRWIAALGFEPSTEAKPLTFRGTAPIVLVAVATVNENADMDHALRRVVKHLITLDDETRFVIVSVISPTHGVAGKTIEELKTNRQVKHQVRLRNWAEPLQLPSERLSFNVIEDGDAAGAILEYVRENSVNHVIIGSPPLKIARKSRLGVSPMVVMSDKATEPLPLIQLMGTVSIRIAAAAPCTVTVVRVHGRN